MYGTLKGRVGGKESRLARVQQSLIKRVYRWTRRFSRSREIPCLPGLGCKYTRERGCDTVQLNGQSGGGMKRTTEDEEAMGGFPNRQESHEAWRRDLQRLQKISQNGGGATVPTRTSKDATREPALASLSAGGHIEPPKQPAQPAGNIADPPPSPATTNDEKREERMYTMCVCE